MADTEGRSGLYQKKGRPAHPADIERLQRLLDTDDYRRDHLIEYLHRIQDEHGGLPAGLLVALAAVLNLAPAEVYEVASFYHHFDIARTPGESSHHATVRVCDSISCAMQGAENLIASLAEQLPDGVRVQRVPCVGRCDRAPVAVVHQNPIERAVPQAVGQAVREKRFEASIPTGTTQLDAYRKQGGYRMLREIAADQTTHAPVIQALDDAGLRGLGGAGFPAGRKWRIVRDEPAPRMLVVNIDEGEPGTFKDRHFLESNPHQFFEGMLIAAKVVGIEAIVISLRDEYAGIRLLLDRELRSLIANPPCELPAIELRRGAGAYICGEESAMIESIEGKRGIPRLRPPYVAQVGLFSRPTLAHNMETLYWVPELLQRGAAWFLSHGRQGRHGLRSFSVSGRVRQPGVYIAPAGISVRELIDEYCGGMAEGHVLKAYLPGGASGGILPASLADLALDFDTLQDYGCFIGSAAVIVLSQQDSVREAALNAMRFFAHESCGQCTPCRVGTSKAAALMARPTWDADLLGDLCEVMAEASICGLGQAAPNPLRCALRYFPEECQAWADPAQ